MSENQDPDLTAFIGEVDRRVDFGADLEDASAERAEPTGQGSAGQGSTGEAEHHAGVVANTARPPETQS